MLRRSPPTPAVPDAVLTLLRRQARQSLAVVDAHLGRAAEAADPLLVDALLDLRSDMTTVIAVVQAGGG
jgi:hypothetical protein